jgi:hypothetical protein
MRDLFSSVNTQEARRRKYYVYELFRPDNNECFYVGKGSGRRAWIGDYRNDYYAQVINQLSEKSLEMIVRIYKDNLTEDEALKIETERLAYWSGRFVKLTNIQKVRFMGTIQCKECGKLFVKKRINQICCSGICRSRYIRRIESEKLAKLAALEGLFNSQRIK